MYNSLLGAKFYNIGEMHVLTIGSDLMMEKKFFIL